MYLNLGNNKVRKCSCCKETDHNLRTCQAPNAENHRKRKSEIKENKLNNKRLKDENQYLFQIWIKQPTLFDALPKNVINHYLEFLTTREQFFLACGIPKLRENFREIFSKLDFEQLICRVKSGKNCYECITKSTLKNASIVQSYKKDRFGNTQTPQTRCSFCIDCTLENHKRIDEIFEQPEDVVIFNSILTVLDENDDNFLRDNVVFYLSKQYFPTKIANNIVKKIEFLKKNILNVGVGII